MIARIGNIDGPHAGQRVLTAGEALHQAEGDRRPGGRLPEGQPAGRRAMVMLHGRGGMAESILDVAALIQQPGFVYLAPQAAGNTWYPNYFLAPLESNEPALSSALAAVGDLLAQLEAAGIPPEHTILMGFSQGACLALEYAARNARRYGGVAALSGGLIGPDGTPRDYAGSLAGTPVFLGCSDVDPHIPLARVRESAEVMRRLGAHVTERIYPGMGHIINQDEMDYLKELSAALVGW